MCKLRNNKIKYVIYCRLPFSSSLKTNIGDEFLKLADKHLENLVPSQKFDQN